MFNYPQVTAMDIFKGAANAIDNAIYDVPGFSNPFRSQPKPTQPPKPAPPKPAPAPVTANNEASDAWKIAKMQYDATMAQINAAPKLPIYDVLGSYNRAKTKAAQTQRPLYDKMLNTFLEQQGIKKQTKQKEISLGRENVSAAQRQAKEDTSTSRERTTEDVNAALDQINRTEGQFQMDEGQEFDREHRVLQEGMAASGLTTSGLGQQAIGEQVDQRNIQSNRQVEEFDIQRGAKELFRNRTFEDLSRADLRADEKAMLDNKQLDFDFESYLSSLAMEETNYRQDWEMDLATAIIEETGRIDAQQRQEWLAGLSGGGLRSQDIAEAYRVWGR